MSDEQRARAVNNRARGRRAEFYTRLLVALFMNITPSCLNLRSKSSNGCDMWPASSAVSKFPFAVEVKLRKSQNVYKLMEQARGNVIDGTFPLALAFEDTPDTSIACIDITLFFSMIRMLNKLDPDWHKHIGSDISSLEFPKWKDAKFNLPDTIIEG